MSTYQFDRREYEKRVAWFQEARFGMFIHWGLYAIPARGEWVRSTEEMDSEVYDRYMGEFYARDYDPRKWARAAREAGMRYVVLTAKHHDGFCLFDTATTDFKATNAPCGRDLVAEFVEAVRAEGLKVGLYYSLLDWHHPDYPHYGDKFHPMRNDPAYGNEKRDFNRYLDCMHTQVRELCTNYGKLDLLFFDFSYEDLRGEAWRGSELAQMVRTLQPGILLNNRLEVSGVGLGSLATAHPAACHGDFVTPEQVIPPQGVTDEAGQPMVWEGCFTMNNNWGFHGTDRFFKPSSMLIQKLVECVSKGGNMLLNVGPDSNGNIPAQSMQILREIGEWMRYNGESIYGCGRADIEKPDFGRVTQKGRKYYFHIFENTIGAIPIAGLDRTRIKRIRALSTGHEIRIVDHFTYANYPHIVFADLGPDPVLPDRRDYVLELEMADVPDGSGEGESGDPGKGT